MGNATWTWVMEKLCQFSILLFCAGKVIEVRAANMGGVFSVSLTVESFT